MNIFIEIDERAILHAPQFSLAAAQAILRQVGAIAGSLDVLRKVQHYDKPR